MSEDFALDWLDLREPFDAAARSLDLAALLVARLPARPRFIDLGAGTGSLMRWLAPLVRRAQVWTLVDQDRELLEAAFDTIADRAESIGYTVSFPNRRTLLVHAPGGAWRVETLVADLAEVPGRLPLLNADAVVSSALCDLVSRRWLERMAGALRIPFYAALCVDGRDRFAPPHPADRLVGDLFRRDQARDKGFGGMALGPQAPAAIAEVFGARGFSVTTRASDWDARGRGLQPLPGMHHEASRFLSELVMGHAEAARAQDRRDDPRIEDWLQDRLDLVAAKRLTARIGHRDILALPAARR